MHKSQTRLRDQNGLTASLSTAGSNTEQMPDIAATTLTTPAMRIDRVGMTGIQAMVRVHNDTKQELLLPAIINAHVSLEDEATRGIHMSRLYLSIQDGLEQSVLDHQSMSRMLNQFISSHKSISKQASLKISYTLPLRRPALLSEHSGWRHYPITLSGTLSEGKMTFSLEVEVTYSSTCPCSAALSRQASQQSFDRDFTDEPNLEPGAVREWLGTPAGMPATPHSQRSSATITVVPEQAEAGPSVCDLINRLETVLATPVQTAVKRVDEQEFARLNGTNLMFCEDAVRRLCDEINRIPKLADYRIQIDHKESLHAHDASAVIVKGAPGGLQP